MSKKLEIGLIAYTKNKFQERLISKEIYMKSSLFRKISFKYEDIPIPVFGHEKSIILQEIEYLES